jgi:hypothetical protein
MFWHQSYFGEGRFGKFEKSNHNLNAIILRVQDQLRSRVARECRGGAEASMHYRVSASAAHLSFTYQLPVWHMKMARFLQLPQFKIR